jgi:glutaconate CoA-transferase subunit B
VIVVVRQTRRSFVDRVDFVTSVGFGDGPGHRERLGLAGAGPRKVITDLGILEPDGQTCELTLTGLYPGVSVEDVRAKTGWDLAVSASLETLEPPTAAELTALRQLKEDNAGQLKEDNAGQLKEDNAGQLKEDNAGRPQGSNPGEPQAASASK